MTAAVLTRFLAGANTVCAEATVDESLTGVDGPALVEVRRLQVNLDLLAEHLTPHSVNDTPVPLPPTKPVDPPPPTEEPAPADPPSDRGGPR